MSHDIPIKKHFLKKIVKLILTIIILLFFFNKHWEPQNTQETLTINSYESTRLNIAGKIEGINAYIADTQKKRILGLSVLENLNHNQGMLFVFDTPRKYGIWMKGMKFPIDIIWLDESKKIIYMKENAQPLDYQNKMSYRPDMPALYVLEVPAGFIKSNNIQIGDLVDF